MSNDILLNSRIFGFPLIIRRVPLLGHLCGYVGIDKNHPYFGKAKGLKVDVHGGVTYAASDVDWNGEQLWWIGFDCAHIGDSIPGIPKLVGTYRDERYVLDQCLYLAQQLDDIKHGRIES